MMTVIWLLNFIILKKEIILSFAVNFYYFITNHCSVFQRESTQVSHLKLSADTDAD